MTLFAELVGDVIKSSSPRAGQHFKFGCIEGASWVEVLDLPGVAEVRRAGIQNEVLDDVDPFCTFSFHPESLGGA